MNSDAPVATHPPLRRSSEDHVLLGVCAGLARTLELRPLTVRIGAVLVGAVAFPLLAIAYAAIALIVPREDGRALLGGEPHDRREQRVGWLTVLTGGFLLLASGFEADRLVWPALDRGGLVLAAIGIGVLVLREGRGAAAAPAVPGARPPGAPPAAPAPQPPTAPAASPAPAPQPSATPAAPPAPAPPTAPAPTPAEPPAPTDPGTTVEGTAVTIDQPAVTVPQPQPAVPSRRGLARILPRLGRGGSRQ